MNADASPGWKQLFEETVTEGQSKSEFKMLALTSSPRDPLEASYGRRVFGKMIWAFCAAAAISSGADAG